jgi:hypothetical protein
MGFGVPLKLSFPLFLVFLEAFPLVFRSFFNHISLCLLNFGQYLSNVLLSFQI